MNTTRDQATVERIARAREAQQRQREQALGAAAKAAGLTSPVSYTPHGAGYLAPQGQT